MDQSELDRGAPLPKHLATTEELFAGTGGVSRENIGPLRDGLGEPTRTAGAGQ